MLKVFGKNTLKNRISAFRKAPHGVKRLYNKREGVLTFIDYKKLRNKIAYAVLLAVLFTAVFVSVFPVFWLLVTSFKSAAEIGRPPYKFWPADFRLSKIKEVWEITKFGTAFFNTFIVTAGAVLCSVLINGLMAYALAILKPYGHRVIFGVIMAGYMIPAMTAMAPLFDALVKLSLMNKRFPLMLAFGANAFYLVMFKSYFESLPRALFEAARIDGCNRLKLFFKIVVPLSGPIIGVVSIFTITAAWSDFLLPYLILRDDSVMTVMVKIYRVSARMNDYQIGIDTLLMLLIISILPIVALFLIFQKRITATSTTSGIK